MTDPYEFAKKTLMTPGPVPLPEYVKKSFAELECHHRSAEFGEILTRVFENLKPVFQTQEHCFLLPCTGTGAMEAAFVNTLNFGDSILTINAGKFGERWGKIGKAFGMKVKELSFPWGKDIDLDLVKKEIESGSYRALAFQACETSTGALLPTKELCEMTKGTPMINIVDGITALGAVNIPMDDWGVDVLVGGSQKAFMLPTGMAFLSLSKKAQGKTSSLPKYYWDLEAERKANEGGKTRYSTPSHFVIALDMVLCDIIGTGVDKYLQQISDKADFFREKVNLDLFPETPSPSLSCLSVGDRNAVEIKKKLSDEGITIVAGQDQLKEKVLRVGHMGAVTRENLQFTADTINKYL